MPFPLKKPNACFLKDAAEHCGNLSYAEVMQYQCSNQWGVPFDLFWSRSAILIIVLYGDSFCLTLNQTAGLPLLSSISFWWSRGVVWAVGSSVLINHANTEWENVHSSAVQHLCSVCRIEGEYTQMVPTEIISGWQLTAKPPCLTVRALIVTCIF